MGFTEKENATDDLRKYEADWRVRHEESAKLLKHILKNQGEMHLRRNVAIVIGMLSFGFVLYFSFEPGPLLVPCALVFLASTFFVGIYSIGKASGGDATSIQESLKVETLLRLEWRLAKLPIHLAEPISEDDTTDSSTDIWNAIEAQSAIIQEVDQNLKFAITNLENIYDRSGEIEDALSILVNALDRDGSIRKEVMDSQKQESEARKTAMIARRKEREERSKDSAPKH